MCLVRQLFLFAVLIKLLEIGPQVACLHFVLDAREDHLGVGNLGAWIVDVFFEVVSLQVIPEFLLASL